jgi:transcription elongation GreA/GreB family factor
MNPPLIANNLNDALALGAEAEYHSDDEAEELKRQQEEAEQAELEEQERQRAAELAE